jgi:NTP pyrophosphatase (non-canonical NTP hydrolase)
MKNINVPALHEEIEVFVSDRDWDQFHSIKNLSMALSVESSELLELFQWMKEEDSNQISSNPVLMEKVNDEVADIFVYLMRIVAKADIDLEKAVRNKMKKNAQKYPVERSRGSSRKYDEF